MSHDRTQMQSRHEGLNGLTLLLLLSFLRLMIKLILLQPRWHCRYNCCLSTSVTWVQSKPLVCAVSLCSLCLCGVSPWCTVSSCIPKPCWLVGSLVTVNYPECAWMVGASWWSWCACKRGYRKKLGRWRAGTGSMDRMVSSCVIEKYVYSTCLLQVNGFRSTMANNAHSTFFLLYVKPWGW